MSSCGASALPTSSAAPSSHSGGSGSSGTMAPFRKTALSMATSFSPIIRDRGARMLPAAVPEAAHFPRPRLDRLELLHPSHLHAHPVGRDAVLAEAAVEA